MPRPQVRPRNDTEGSRCCGGDDPSVTRSACQLPLGRGANAAGESDDLKFHFMEVCYDFL